MEFLLWIFPAIFIILGIVFLQGKGSFLIAGYNTSSNEEKEKYNKYALCRFMGKVCLSLAIISTLMVFGTLYSIAWLFPVGFTLLLVTSIGIVIYANTGNRFRK